MALVLLLVLMWVLMFLSLLANACVWHSRHVAREHILHHRRIADEYRCCFCCIALLCCCCFCCCCHRHCSFLFACAVCMLPHYPAISHPGPLYLLLLSPLLLLLLLPPPPTCSVYCVPCIRRPASLRRLLAQLLALLALFAVLPFFTPLRCFVCHPPLLSCQNTARVLLAASYLTFFLS